MARSAIKAEAFIRLDNGEELPWYTVYTDGTVVWHLPEEASARYRQQMTKHIGEEMSLYLAQHPEAGLWDTP